MKIVKDFKYAEIKLCNELANRWEVDLEIIDENTFMFSDCFLSIHEVITNLEKNVTFGKFLQWYDAVVYDNKRISLSNFLRYGFLDELEIDKPTGTKDMRKNIQNEINKLTLKLKELKRDSKEFMIVSQLIENLIIITTA